MIELLYFCLFHKNKKRKTGLYACMKTPQLEYDFILNTDLMKDDVSSAVPFTGGEHKKNQSHVIHRLMSCGEGGGNAVAMVILLVVSFHLSRTLNVTPTQVGINGVKECMWPKHGH